MERTLPSGARIRCLPPDALLATKLEAFADRGAGDYLGAPDFEDIVVLVDGREELVDEVARASRELRTYVAAELRRYLDRPRAREAIVAHLEGGRGGRTRAEEVTMPRFQRLAGFSSCS